LLDHARCQQEGPQGIGDPSLGRERKDRPVLGKMEVGAIGTEHVLQDQRTGKTETLRRLRGRVESGIAYADKATPLC
jgi:hypothetical protein